MDGWIPPKLGAASRSDADGYVGTDEVSRLWVGLEHQQEVLGPIAVELMALLCPDTAGVNDPDAAGVDAPGSGTDITSRG